MDDHVGYLGEVEFDAVEDLAGAGELMERERACYEWGALQRNNKQQTWNGPWQRTEP